MKIYKTNRRQHFIGCVTIFFLKMYMKEQRKLIDSPDYVEELTVGNHSDELIRWGKEMDMLVNAYNLLSR